MLVHPHPVQAEYGPGHRWHITGPLGFPVRGFEPAPGRQQIAVTLLCPKPMPEEVLGVIEHADPRCDALHTRFTPLPHYAQRGSMARGFNGLG